MPFNNAQFLRFPLTHLAIVLCAQPCMNAITLISYRYDRELSSVYFDMQLINLYLHFEFQAIELSFALKDS